MRRGLFLLKGFRFSVSDIEFGVDLFWNLMDEQQQMSDSLAGADGSFSIVWGAGLVGEFWTVRP